MTTGVEPPDYVPETCMQIPINVMNEALGQPVGTPLPVGGSNILFQSTKAARSADLIDLPFGNHADDELFRLGQNHDDVTKCTGDGREGWPAWHFVFRLDAEVDLTVAIGRTSGAANDADKHGNVYDLANLNNPSHTLRKIGGERPREATDIVGPSDTVPYFYIDIDQAPAEDCFTAGETPPCETASGTYRGLTPGTYALSVTMDPPGNKPNRVTDPGPFSVALATAASQGFGPEGPADRTGTAAGSSGPVINTLPVFTAEAADQTARLYEAFSYTAPQATVDAGATVSYSAWLSDLSKLPDWLSFNAATRTFSGTPEIGDFPATLDIVILATDEDAYPQTAMTDFTLTVARPTWNMPPRFHEGDESTTRTLAENSPAGTKVGKPVTAFDPNGDALSYLFLDGADAASFSLDPDTGQLTTVDGVAYDYEAKSTYDDLLVIVMETNTVEGNLTGISVTVNLTDVQEEETTSGDGSGDTDESTDQTTDESTTEPETPANTAPSFGSGAATALSVDENSAAGTNVGSAFTATDPDEGDTVTYSLSGTDAASFEIGSSSGQITTRTGVAYNYEARSSYSLTVEASDGTLSDTIAVTVSLNDVAEAPTVSDTSAFKTHYATVGSTFTLTLPAADANSGDGGPYTYILWHKGAGKNFATEAVNGLSFDAATRTLSGTPEAEGTWQLNYVVHDGDDNRNAAADAFRERTKLKIVVAPSGQATGDGGTGPQESRTEPANSAPSFGSGVVTALKVDENSPAGTNVGSALTATDPDTGDTLTYSLSGTDAASFDIGSSTGQITTKTGVTYDYESKSSYSLTVKASDGTLSDSVAVTVSLNDVNEAPAFAAGASATLAVDENSPAGTSVGAAIAATDPDTGDTLTYSLSGTDAASFAIDSTGQLTTASGVTLDHETKTSYALSVDATDGTLTASIAVTVNVTNVNEAPAFAAGASATLEVDENSPAGTSVGAALGAADPDSGDTLTYSLSGTDAASFAIDSTGQLSTATGVTLDYETKRSYSLTVTATDSGGLGDSVSVTVNVTDIAPTASAGADFDGRRGEEVTLSGSGTAHADGSRTLTYQWTVSDASEDELVTVGKKPEFLADADKAEATFTVPRRKHVTTWSFLDNGQWIEFTLTVTDGDGESHADTVRMTIQGTTWKKPAQ